MNLQTDTREIKSLGDGQMDAVVLAGLLKSINNLDMEETCEGVRGSLNAIAVERINRWCQTNSNQSQFTAKGRNLC